MEKLILKYTLQNAIRYNGKAKQQAIIGKIAPYVKKINKPLLEKISQIVKKVNSLSLEQQKQQLKKISPSLLKKKQQKKDIFSFLKIKGKVITAFPPDPSKYPHIGHAKSALLNYELAKRYNGKFYLRFEDTNPEIVKKEFYRIHIKDYKWLGIKPDKITYASDHIKDFYKYAKNLIKKNKAYVCLCSRKKIKQSRLKSIPCSCRKNTIEKNLQLWKKMFITKKGILRLKINLKHKNTVMRDPTIMRVVLKKHPRKNYIVWPTYDFENPLMDSIEKITHRLRSKEFELRSELHKHIQKLLGFKPTFTYEYARFNLKGVPSSGRVIKQLIKEKKLSGWDDPSLTTLTALKRRGFLPQAIRNFLLSTGISKTESTLTWDDLIIHNKRLLDKKAKRYFFIENPKKIKIQNAPKLKIKLKLHPESKIAKRLFKTHNKFYITDKIQKNKIYRFIGLFNFKNKKFLSKEYNKDLKAKLIHWLPFSKDLIKTQIIMPDSTIKTGLLESNAKNLKVDEIVQLVRFGFARLDNKKQNKFTFYFTHK